MQIIAVQKYVRTSPRKVRLVANAVKGMPVATALQQLSVMERRASQVVMKVMRQAIANAIHNHNLKAGDLKIESIQIQGGPTYKRFRAVSRGRAHTIMKRTSHVMVTLKTAEADKKATETQKTETKAAAKPAATKAEPAPKAVEKKTETKKTAVKKTTKKETKPSSKTKSTTKKK